MNKIEGSFDAKGKRFGIVIARFNHFIGKELVVGAEDCLIRHGVSSNDIDIVYVPGTFEAPLAASLMARSKKYNAIICLGVLVRGSTPHFDYIAAEATKGIGQASLQTGIPISYGIITADNLEQAIERAGTKAGNKGWDATLAAIEMADLVKKIGENNVA